MDEATDAGHDEDHDGRQRVDPEGDVDAQAPDVDPGEQVGEQEAVLGIEADELEEGDHRQHERDRDRAARDAADQVLSEAALERRARRARAAQRRPEARAG